MTATPEAHKGPSAAAAETPAVVEMVDLYLNAEAVRIAVPMSPRRATPTCSSTGRDPLRRSRPRPVWTADALGRLLRLLASPASSRRTATAISISISISIVS